MVRVNWVIGFRNFLPDGWRFPINGRINSNPPWNCVNDYKVNCAALEPVTGSARFFLWKEIKINFQQIREKVRKTMLKWVRTRECVDAKFSCQKSLRLTAAAASWMAQNQPRSSRPNQAPQNFHYVSFAAANSFHFDDCRRSRNVTKKRERSEVSSPTKLFHLSTLDGCWAFCWFFPLFTRSLSSSSSCTLIVNTPNRPTNRLNLSQKKLFSLCLPLVQLDTWTREVVITLTDFCRPLNLSPLGNIVCFDKRRRSESIWKGNITTIHVEAIRQMIFTCSLHRFFVELLVLS